MCNTARGEFGRFVYVFTHKLLLLYYCCYYSYRSKTVQFYRLVQRYNNNQPEAPSEYRKIKKWSRRAGRRVSIPADPVCPATGVLPGRDWWTSSAYDLPPGNTIFEHSPKEIKKTVIFIKRHWENQQVRVRPYDRPNTIYYWRRLLVSWYAFFELGRF